MVAPLRLDARLFALGIVQQDLEQARHLSRVVTGQKRRARAPAIGLLLQVAAVARDAMLQKIIADPQGQRAEDEASDDLVALRAVRHDAVVPRGVLHFVRQRRRQLRLVVEERQESRCDVDLPVGQGEGVRVAIARDEETVADVVVGRLRCEPCAGARDQRFELAVLVAVAALPEEILQGRRVLHQLQLALVELERSVEPFAGGEGHPGQGDTERGEKETDCGGSR